MSDLKAWSGQSCPVCRSIALSIGLAVGLAQVAQAQITPDDSLGAERSNLLPTGVIEGGARRGANLFHSFSDFNVGDGQRIDFANPAGVERILGRVTGTSRSTILGTIGVLGPADLFLINPNGIVFGRNARLAVQGSFLATTANAVQFGNQGVFSASAPDAPALLTVNPSALWFNQRQAAPIVNRSIASAGVSPGGFGVFGLRVPNGRSLLLVGGAVQLDQGSVAALGGRVELGGLAAPGVVGLTGNGLSFPAGVERADVLLTNGASVDVAAGSGGDIVMTANNINIGTQSGIFAGIVAPGGTIARQAGTIALNATGAINLDGQGSTIENSVSANAAGNSGDIQINARTFSVTNGAGVVTLSGSQGNAGNIRIATADAIDVSGFGTRLSSAITSQVRPGRAGTGGTITLSTRNLTVTNSGSLGTATFGRGNAGNVTITADTIAVDGVGSTRSSGITSSVAPQAVGNGGIIDIQTGVLSITNGGRLFASTFGQGNGGDIRVNARDRVALDGSGSNQFSSAIVSQVATPGVGKGGNLQITAPTVTLTKGAQLAASTFGRGRAGDISVQARDAVVFDGVGSNNVPSGAFSNVDARAIGNGGNISISSDTFRLTNDAGLFASTNGRGDAGAIRVQAETAVLTTGGRIFSSVEPTGIGNGQEIAIQARSLALTSRAEINASTAGDGEAGQIRVDAETLEINTGGRLLTTTTSRRDAGDIRLQVRDRVNVTGAESGLFANTAVGSSGNGGTISVDSTALTLQGAARISVDSQGTGVGGNLEIQAEALTLDRASISAETQSNTGGNITLNLPSLLLLRRGSSISTTAGKAQGTGDGGNINLAAGFVVAVLGENSDITANAFQGNGGNINITTQGIFGIAFRDRLTPLSDITASSEFGVNGIVTINTPEIDPTQQTPQLPTTFSAPPLAQGCRVQGDQTSRFVNAGRGGVPQNPSDPLIPDILWQDLEPIESSQHGTRAAIVALSQPSADNIVEAQGWVNRSGAVVLTADASTATPYGISTGDRCVPSSQPVSQ